MTIRKYTITDRLLISADELTPRQADAFWLDVVELADQHRVTLHGTRLVEVDTAGEAPAGDAGLQAAMVAG